MKDHYLTGHKESTFKCVACDNKSSSKVDCSVQVNEDHLDENTKLPIPIASQINTLKNSLTMKEHELNKLKESNELQAKQIVQLEEQLGEAQKFVTVSEDSHSTNEKPIYNTSELTDKIDELTAKFDYFKSSFETNESKCKNCPCQSGKDNAVNVDDGEHPEKPNHVTPNFMCDRCSYVAFHNRDLNRHKHVMHKIPFNCFRCGSEFDDKSSLLLHIKTNHRPSKYFYPTNPEKKEVTQTPIFCHFFNNDKECHYKEKCKFLHKTSPQCRRKNMCNRKNCMYRHNIQENTEDKTKSVNKPDENEKLQENSSENEVKTSSDEESSNKKLEEKSYGEIGTEINKSLEDETSSSEDPTEDGESEEYKEYWERKSKELHEVEKLETKAVEKSIETEDEKLAEESSRFFLD